MLLIDAERKLNFVYNERLLISETKQRELAFWRKLWLNELLHIQLKEFNYADAADCAFPR